MKKADEILTGFSFCFVSSDLSRHRVLGELPYPSGCTGILDVAVSIPKFESEIIIGSLTGEFEIVLKHADKFLILLRNYLRFIFRFHIKKVLEVIHYFYGASQDLLGAGLQREPREYSFFMRHDEKKEDYREEPICWRRGNVADQGAACYLCIGKILCLDFDRKLA